MERRFRLSIRCFTIAAALFLCGSTMVGQDPPAVDTDLMKRAGVAAQQFIDHMGAVRYNEHVSQTQLKDSGKVNYQQDAYFDGLTIVRHDNGRLVADETSESSQSSAGFEMRPLLQTSGFSTLALIVHPYYESSFRFSPLDDDVEAGRPVKLIHFEHIKGAESPTALRLRGRDYPLDMSGILYMDRETGVVVRVVALLSEPLDDIGLKSLNCDVHYAPVSLPETPGSFWLPESAQIELRTPKQHWRNFHTFNDYRKYSVDVTIGPGELK